MMRLLSKRSFVTGSSSSSGHILGLWKKVLSGVIIDDEPLKDAIARGIAVSRGRSQNIFADEIVSYFRKTYAGLDLPRKGQLFHSLARHFSLDSSAINRAIIQWQKNNRRSPVTATAVNAPSLHHPPTPVPSNAAATDEIALRAAERLFHASQPLYAHLWSPLAQQTDGVAFLVELRTDLLRCIAASPSAAGPLRLMSENLRRTLAGWFSVGLLQLERVTWESSSAAMLEKIAQEEKVHKIRDWRSLKRRLSPLRRAFVWTHPSMPGEPLVALHIALCHEVAGRMDEILNNDTEEEERNAASDPFTAAHSPPPTVAIFYSISTMKPGLSGIDLGNNLIKRAAKELLAEVPSLITLATLSPLPGFSAWLETKLTRVEQGLAPLSDLHLKYRELVKLQRAVRGGAPLGGDRSQNAAAGAAAAAVLRRALHGGEWMRDEALSEALKGPLLRLAAKYLMIEKHRGRALDPVANFHIRNGASVGRLNWRADTSVAGVRRSHGVMVNYVYDLAAVEERNRLYMMEGRISVAPEVVQLLEDAAGMAPPN